MSFTVAPTVPQRARKCANSPCAPLALRSRAAQKSDGLPGTGNRLSENPCKQIPGFEVRERGRNALPNSFWQ